MHCQKRYILQWLWILLSLYLEVKSLCRPDLWQYLERALHHAFDVTQPQYPGRELLMRSHDVAIAFPASILVEICYLYYDIAQGPGMLLSLARLLYYLHIIHKVATSIFGILYVYNQSEYA